MEDATRHTLSKIVEKAEKLRRFGFEKHIREVGLGFRGSKNDDGTWEIELGVPDEKERDAFILTFRLFYQKNEPISLFNLDKVCTDINLSTDFKSKILEIRSLFLEFLDGSSEYTVHLFEDHPTRRDMFEAYFYGMLLHTNSQSDEVRFKHWTRDDLRRDLFEQEISRFLLYVLELIYSLENCCIEELQKSVIG